jgi:hypothetical protein
MGRRWLCYDHERVHDESEQAVYCVDGEWIEDDPPPPVSEFRARWNETMLRARGQHPDQVEATIRTLGVCDRRTEATVSAWPEASLPWSTAWQRLTGRGCRARWPVAGTGYGRARCELVRDHRGDHALERGMDTPRWKTDT